MSTAQDLKERLERLKQLRAQVNGVALPLSASIQTSIPTAPSLSGIYAIPHQKYSFLNNDVNSAKQNSTSDTCSSFSDELNVPPSLTSSGHPLDYRGKASATHVRANRVLEHWAAGKKRSRCMEEEGLVRVVPLKYPLVDIEDKYLPPEEGKKIGSGVYGSVYKGVEKKLGRECALKELKQKWIEDSPVGFPPYLLREVDILLRLKHPNIVQGIELGRTKDRDSLFIVTEYAGTTLKSFMFSSAAYIHLSSRNIHPEAPRALVSKLKCITQQLLRGIDFLHSHCVVHRDLKSANVLIDRYGIVRICDYGLARFYQEGCPLTQGTVTLLYRAPELHFGMSDYNTKVDIWSAACIIAELVLKGQLFPGEPEAQHFSCICSILGMPNERSNFPGYLLLPHAMAMMKALTKYNRTNRLKNVFAASPYRGARECVSDTLLDMLQSMLKWNPKDRPSAGELLQHAWFSEEPLPCKAEQLLLPLPTKLISQQQIPLPFAVSSSPLVATVDKLAKISNVSLLVANAVEEKTARNGGDGSVVRAEEIAVEQACLTEEDAIDIQMEAASGLMEDTSGSGSGDERLRNLMKQYAETDVEEIVSGQAELLQFS